MSHKPTRVTVSLTERDHTELSALGERLDVSLSWLIRKAVTEYLMNHRPDEMQLPLPLKRRPGERQ